MNANKFCPSCGEPTTPEMKTCPNCGENLMDEASVKTNENEVLKKAQSILEDNEASKDGIQIGSRSNVVGGITGRKIETQSMTENNNTHVEANTTNSISTSNVDNSQKVVNSNTNNVTYNIIYQNPVQGGPQIPNQGQGIPDFNPGGPQQINPTPQGVPNDKNQKGIGAIAGDQGIKPKTGENTNGNTMKIIAACIGIAVVVGLFFVFKTPGETTSQQNDSTPKEQVKEVAGSGYTEQPATRQVQSEEFIEVKTAPASTKKTATPTEKVTDSNYEKGMKAYQSKEGLDAIKYFKSSGSAESNYMLGVIYEQGCGNVAANAMMARKYFKTAAKMGSESAKAKL